jgi:hypothetical protein
LLALAASFLMTLSANQRVESDTAPRGQEETATDTNQLASPAAAYTAFRKAQATQDWSREYPCYSPRQQARFSHTIVITALYLEFETDLYLEVEAALSRHGLSEEDLADFWPQTKFRAVDLAAPEDSYKEIQAEYNAKVDRWQREVLPKIRDCTGLIATLQPLIREAARRSSSTSTCALTVHQLEGYAYGRLQDVCVDGDRATGRIRVKSRFGAFVEPESLEKRATEPTSENDVLPSATEFRNVVLEDASGLYCWLWEVAADIQTLAKSMPHPRMVIVGLATGDVAVSPFQIDADFDDTLGLDARDADKGETPVLERDDEGEEVGLANNGTRTVTEGAVKFQRIGGRWLVDSIDCR